MLCMRVDDMVGLLLDFLGRRFKLLDCWVDELIGRFKTAMRTGSTGGPCVLWASIYQVGLELNVSCNA